MCAELARTDHLRLGRRRAGHPEDPSYLQTRARNAGGSPTVIIVPLSSGTPMSSRPVASPAACGHVIDGWNAVFSKPAREDARTYEEGPARAGARPWITRSLRALQVLARHTCLVQIKKEYESMANYNYTEGVISRYHMQRGKIIIRVKITDRTGTFTNVYSINYAQFLASGAEVGTKVSLRENLNLPSLVRTWEFVDFLH
jgi:hypothetical protein